MTTKKSPKIPQKYYCNLCNYNTCNIKDYNKHLLTQKHKNNKLTTLDNTENPNLTIKIYTCEKCKKKYNDRTGLWRHNKKCNIQDKNIQIKDLEINKETEELKELIKYLMKENMDFKNIMINTQNQMVNTQNQMLKVIENGISNNSITNITNTNSHNKSFNLNFFLNETCKNAMNITDFINSLQLQLSDLEKVGEVGYVEGISNIIIKNLNALDVTLRPVHCTDKKRETMYVKDENKWEKEDDSNTKLHKMVRKVSNKNMDLITEFKELHPDWKKSSSKVSDQFDKIIIETMGGKGDNDYEKEEKIIKKIAKEVYIDKLDKL
jgi:hypothetical protein